MIICPWCGTNYRVFQQNCGNCGGILQLSEETDRASSDADIAVPPAPPRKINENYIWRLLLADGWAITAFIFGLMGIIFGFVGAGLTLGIITAFVGVPFLLIGIIFLIAGIGLVLWRYQETAKLVNVLRIGESTRGTITALDENYSVSISGRHPWIIRYQYQINGNNYEGKVTTLNQVGDKYKVGKSISILYLPGNPQWSSIYPHP